MSRRFLLSAVVLLALGCQQSGTNQTDGTANGNGSGTGKAKKIRIAVIPKGTTHEFWKSVHAGAQNAARELGNVEILWKGPQEENDREGQISVVQDFITKQVDGICLAPLDSQALLSYVIEAGEADIPVVIFDSGLDGDPKNYVTYVATDNHHGGVLAGRRLGEVLEGKGNIVLLRYNPGSESTTQREDGFLETIEKEFPNLNVLTSNEYAGTTPESSLTKATQVLQKYRDKIDGIFAVCEPNASGVLVALEDMELAGKVKFVAFDPNQPLVEGMTKKTVNGIVLQDPVSMGYQAVMSIVGHIRGDKIDKRISTGEYIATPENMNEPGMNKLLKPEQFED